MESNRKVLLLYGFNENEKKSLKKLVMENKIPIYKCINKNMGTTSLEFILNNINNQVYEGELPEEKVVLFNNCKDKEVITAISAIKETFHQNPIFAIITEMTIKWSFKDLLNHLIEERELFKNNTK